MRFVIISGLSGSGKSVALHTLEDAGFYCIDNLPVGMLEAFGAHITNSGIKPSDRFAVGIDARNRPDDLARFPEILEHLEQRGVKSEIVFLQASEDTLIKRFSETRRRHPLSGPGVPLADAIRQENRLLSPILADADLTLDTTTTNVHQLRELLRERLEMEGGQVSLLFESFGYKHGLPADADFVFDARCLPNPHWELQLRPLTGRDPEVRAFLDEQSSVQEMLRQIEAFLDQWVPCFERENRSYLTVAVGCTGGQHRSVYMIERIADHFRSTHDKVTVRHRELS